MPRILLQALNNSQQHVGPIWTWEPELDYGRGSWVTFDPKLHTIPVTIQEPIEEPVTIEEPIKKQVKGPVKKQVKEPVKEQIKEPVKEQIEEPVKEPVKEQIEEPVKEQIEEPAKEPVSVEEPVQDLSDDEGANPYGRILAG